MGRSFWLANAVILLDEVLYLALIPLLPSYAEQFGLSKTETGFLYAAYPLFVLLASVPAGFLVDRVGSKKMLLIGCLLLVAATVGFAFSATAWQLWLTRAVQGLTAGLVATAGMAGIVAGARTDRRATTIGIAISLQGLSAIVGYALGGFVSPIIGVKATFLIPAVVGAVFCVAIAVSPSEAPPIRSEARLRDALADALRSTAVRASVACILAVGVVGSAVQTLGSLELDSAGYSVSALGGVFVIAACLGLASTPVAGHLADRHGVPTAILVWSCITPLLVLGLALPSAPAWLIAALLATILPMVRVGGLLAYARGAQYAELGAGLAVGYGLAVTAWSVGAVVGPLTAGAIADASTPAVAFVAIAVIALVLAIPASRRDPLPVQASG